MILLQAALAFSVLMIALSTAATSLTEVYLRTFSRRPRVLARALYQFFKTHPDAETLLKRVINSQDDKTQKFRQDVVDGINKTESKILNAIRKQRGNDTELDALALKTVMDVARNPSIETRSVAPRPRWMVDKLSTYAFLQRLADTDLVRTYIDDSQLPDKIEEEVLKRLSLGFERYICLKRAFPQARAAYHDDRCVHSRRYAECSGGRDISVSSRQPICAHRTRRQRRGKTRRI